MVRNRLGLSGRLGFMGRSIIPVTGMMVMPARTVLVSMFVRSAAAADIRVDVRTKVVPRRMVPIVSVPKPG